MKRPKIDWGQVEAAMRRATNGSASARDTELCMSAFRRAPKEYGKRNRRVRREEQENYARAFRSV